MDPKLQVTLAEDKSQISQVSDHFLELTLLLNVGTSLLEQRGSWKLVVSCVIYRTQGLRYCCFERLKYDLVER